MAKDILKEVAEWLRQGTPEAEHIVDLPWVVEMDEKEGVLVATTAPYPFRLLVFYREDLHAIRLVIETRIKTVFMDKAEKLKVYHYLLIDVNRRPYVKAYLFGDEHEVAITADISSIGLNKESFDDVLTFLVGTLGLLYDKLGKPEEIEEEAISLLYITIKKWYEQGWAKERIKKLLMRGGLKEKEAEEMINEVLKIAERKSRETEKEPNYFL